MKLDLPTVSEGTWDGVDSNFSAYNSGGVEIEVGELLYGFVRALKPKKVLETGTHYGISSTYIGMGLRDNGFGKLITIENVADNFNRATKLHKENGVDKYVDILLEDVRAVELRGEFDMFLLDSEPTYRFNELVRFYPYLTAGKGYVFIHDLHAHASQENDCMPFGKMPQEIIDWVQNDKLRPFSFPTPRGLMGFYKPGERDYRWEEVGKKAQS